MKDYYNEGITETLDDPINVEAQKTMDPFSYRERLTMPKLLIQVNCEIRVSDKLEISVTDSLHSSRQYCISVTNI